MKLDECRTLLETDFLERQKTRPPFLTTKNAINNEYSASMTVFTRKVVIPIRPLLFVIVLGPVGSHQ